MHGNPLETGKAYEISGRDFGKSPKSLPDTAAASENRAAHDRLLLAELV